MRDARAPSRSASPNRGGSTSEPIRRRQRAVLAACRRLGLDRDARVEVQTEITGKPSMANMSAADLDKLLDHLNRGWKPGNADRPHVPKIRALWWSLYWLGEIEEPADRALDAFVKRQTGVDRLAFLDVRKSHSVIEAMKSWLERAGVTWPADADIEAMQIYHPDYNRVRAERHAVLEALADRVVKVTDIEIPIIFAKSKIGAALTQRAWSERQIDDAIRVLGTVWRRQRPSPPPSS